MTFPFRSTFIVAVLLFASPAYASGSTPLPEPSSAFLLSMGLAGLLIGRRLASKRGSD